MTDFGSQDDGATALAFQPDGRIVAAGFTASGSRYQFALARYLGATLGVETAGDGVGAVTSSPAGIRCGATCSAPFAPVTVVLTATPSSRSTFAGWSGDCSGKGTCTLTMSTDRTVVATFVARCVVPKVQGKKLKEAKRAITRAHCSVGKVRASFSPKMKKGRVISQQPRPGKKLAPRAKVRLKVSKGKRL
jgi:hypothetical protein